MRHYLAWAVSVGSLASLAACAPPPELPVFALTGRGCDASPMMAAAVPVPFGNTAGVAVKLNANSPCLTTAGQVVTYVVFRLPEVSTPSMVTVSSAAVGSGMVSPRVTVYDGAGAVTRTIEPAEFRASISGLQTGLRPRPDDRLLVVAADLATLGQPMVLRLSAREIGVQVAATVFVPIIINTSVPPQLKEHWVALSLNGQVRVAAIPIETVP